MYQNRDRHEVHKLLTDARGRTLVGYETTRAFGYPADEAGSITLLFDGDLVIHLSPTGYEADGILVTTGRFDEGLPD